MSSPPVKYVRQADFTTFSTTHPDDQQPGVDLDNELNTLATTVNKTIDRLGEIQRSDGALANLVVSPDSLSVSTKALLLSTGVPRGAWVTLTAYIAKDLITQAGITYICVTPHTAGVFATDLAAGKWMIFAQPAYNQSLNTSDNPTFATLSLTAALNVAGVTKFSDGTAPAPALTFTSDPDTGFFHQGANVIGVACGGALAAFFGSSGVSVGSTTYVKGDTVPGTAASNNALGAIGLYTKCLIFISWNGGAGYALVVIGPSGTAAIIASSNAVGGDNCFDTTNGSGSNGGNGVAFFNSGGFAFIQTKNSYAGGVITVHRFGG